MDKFGSDVSGFFNRSLQKAEETFKTAEKTAIDANVEKLTQDCNVRNKWAQSLVGLIEAVSEPNPANRMEDKVLSNFDRKKERSSEYEKLGESMISIGESLGPQTPQGEALKKCGQCQNTIGAAGRDLQQSIEVGTLVWLRGYINNCKAALVERKTLEDHRLSLDRSKTLLKRAGNDHAKKQKHQDEVNKAQAEFNAQTEVARKHLQTCVDEFNENKDYVQHLLDAQKNYYQKCLQSVNAAV